MGQKLLETMDGLPGLATTNIEISISAARLESIELPNLAKEKAVVFGHTIDATRLELAEMDLQHKIQIIEDWEKAKNIIKNMLEKEGITPKAIVPTKVFEEISQEMGLFDLKEMNPENASLNMNPFKIDFEIFKTFIDAHFSFSGNQRSFGQNMSHLLNRENTCKINYRENNFIITNEDFPEIKENDAEDSDLDLKKVLFYLNTNDFYEKVLENEQIIDTKRKEIEEVCKNLKERSFVYNLVKLPFKKHKKEDIGSLMFFEHFMNGQLKSKVIMPELPKEYQDLLIKLKIKFPAWPVYTTADPEFIRLTYAGVDIYEYAQARTKFWKNFFEELISKIPELKNTSKEMNERLQKELAKIGKVPSKSHIILSEEHLKQIIEIEKDPIFYAPIKQVYKNIEYDMTIIWGQYGNIPKEKIVIDKLSKIDQTIFLGSQMN